VRLRTVGVALVAVVAACGDAPKRVITASPPVTATTAPAGTATATTPVVQAPPDPRTRAAGLVAAAEDLRGLRRRRPLAVRVVDRRGMAAVVARILRRDPDPTVGPGFDAALHALGVLHRGQRLAAVVRRSLTQGVAGLYDPATRRLYVVGADGGAPASVIVHEATHALQDQAFDLRRAVFGARPADADGALAAHAVVEGDATDVQQRYLLQAGVLGALGEGLAALQQLRAAGDVSLPPFLEREQTFPYLAGAAFVGALRARGGDALVGRALRTPPRTTAAILDPARYLGGDPPAVRVAVPSVPRGGRRLVDTTFGAEDLLALTGDKSLAARWRGGRLVVDRLRNGATRARVVLAVRGTRVDVVIALAKALPASAHVGGTVVPGTVLVDGTVPP
jgi:hypothetical protein